MTTGQVLSHITAISCFVSVLGWKTCVSPPIALLRWKPCWFGSLRNVSPFKIGRRITRAYKIDSAARTGFWLTCAHKSVQVIHTEPSGDGVGLVNVIIFLAVQQTQALIRYWWVGVGWGGVITFMFLCTHRHSNLTIFLAAQKTQALLIHDQLPVGWGGVGWGGVITFMFLCTHRHSNLIIFLAVQQTQALLIHDQLPVGWGGAG